MPIDCKMRIFGAAVIFIKPLQPLESLIRNQFFNVFIYGSYIDRLATIVMSKNQVLQNLQYMCQRIREFRRLVTKPNQPLLHRTDKRMIFPKRFFFLIMNYFIEGSFHSTGIPDMTGLLRNHVYTSSTYVHLPVTFNFKTHSILMRVT